MKPINLERTLVGARMTIYPRGKRRIFYADFHHNGQHCRRSLRTTIKRVAVRRAARLEQSMEDGRLPSREARINRSNARMSLADAAKEFVAFSETEGRRRRTVIKQRGILNRFCQYANENHIQRLIGVDLRLIDKYRSTRKEDLSPKSMHNEGQLLKQFFGWCAERQLITSNPLSARKFRPPKYEPREGPTLQQINAILKAVTATRYPVLATLAFTGARSGEVSYLRVEDVDLEGNWLHYVSRAGFETKSGKSRKLPIHERLRPVLEEAVRGRKTGWLFTALPSRKYPQGDHFISIKHVNEDFISTVSSYRR